MEESTAMTQLPEPASEAIAQRLESSVGVSLSDGDGPMSNEDEDHRNIMESLEDMEGEEGSSTASGSDVMQQFEPAQGIPEPNPNDILCGRGRSTSDHPANVRFRELVSQNKDGYQKAKRRDDKTKITCELVDLLRRDGRFVLFDPKTKLWYEVSDDYAREKVSHSLRSRPMENRRSRPKLKKKILRQSKHSPALDDVVMHILQDQQSILKAMMQKESNRMAAEAIMRATLGQPSV